VNLTDLIIIFFFFFCLIRGIFRGTIKEASSIITTFCGLIVAAASYEQISHFIFSWIDKPQMRHLCGFLLTFTINFLFINFLSIMLINSLHIRNSGVGSRMSGAVMGFSKGLLLSSVLIIPLVGFSTNNSKYFNNSSLFSLEANVAQQVIHMTPREIRHRFNKKITN
jgi:membrane protein required for colicin V production